MEKRTWINIRAKQILQNMAEKPMEKEMLKSNGLRRHELLFNNQKSKTKLNAKMKRTQKVRNGIIVIQTVSPKMNL